MKFSEFKRQINEFSSTYDDCDVTMKMNEKSKVETKFQEIELRFDARNNDIPKLIEVILVGEL